MEIEGTRHEVVEMRRMQLEGGGVTFYQSCSPLTGLNRLVVLKAGRYNCAGCGGE